MGNYIFSFFRLAFLKQSLLDRTTLQLLSKKIRSTALRGWRICRGTRLPPSSTSVKRETPLLMNWTLAWIFPKCWNWTQNVFNLNEINFLGNGPIVTCFDLVTLLYCVQGNLLLWPYHSHTFFWWASTVLSFLIFQPELMYLILVNLWPAYIVNFSSSCPFP